MHTITATIQSYILHTPHLLYLTLALPKPFSYVPGQYILLQQLHRAYSIANYHPDQLEIVIKLITDGHASQYLRKQTVGNKLIISGPAGHFRYRSLPHRHVVCIAGGTGIAPIRSMWQANVLPLNTHIYWGVHDYADICFQDIPITPCISTINGRVQNHIVISPETDYYVCGSGTFVTGVSQWLQAHAVPKTALFVERYS